MQAYEGYFENGRFYAAGRTIRIPERRRVFLTVLEEPPIQLLNTDDNKAFWAEFDRLVDGSADEVLRFEDFPRCQIGRELVVLSDDEEGTNI